MEAREYRLIRKLWHEHWWFVGRRGFVKDFLSKIDLPMGAKLLDIGAGAGGEFVFLNGFGKVFEIEISSLGIRLNRNKKTLVQANATDLPVRENQIDLVTAFDVLYHKRVKRDRLAIFEAFRVLRPNGYFLLTDSAMPSIYSSHDKALRTRERYKLSELETKIKSCGFEIIRSSYVFFLLFPFVWFVKVSINKLRAPKSNLRKEPSWINWLLTMVCKLELYLVRKFSLPWGSSLIIMARKPVVR